MVLKNPGPLWCRLGFGPARDKPRTEHPVLDPAQSGPHSPLPPAPDGGVGESPARPLSPAPRPKRSSFTTFFAFSSKRRSSQGAPFLSPPQSVSGKWLSDRGQTRVHLINPSSIPSPLLVDDDEYYYSYYAAATPTFPSLPASPNPDVSPTKRLSSRQHDLVGNPDQDSHPSSPVDSPSRNHLQHPYAYSTPLYPQPVSPPLRHATSQPFRHHHHGSRSDINAGPSHGKTPHHRRDASSSQPHLLQPQLKTSISAPNLAAAAAAPARQRSVLKKKPKERWLSAETWWDAVFSPSPRFKVKQAPPSHPPAGTFHHEPTRSPVQGDPQGSLATTFPPVVPPRPRAVSVNSVASSIRPTLYLASRSRSAADIIGRHPSASTNLRAGFEPALETLVDERTPTPEQAPSTGTQLPLLDPPVSLEQVIGEGEAFEHQRAQWKKQATRSIGNKHTRSFSRARSKSLGEKQPRGPHTSEGSKAQLNLEFLAARTLLGSQSTMPTVHISKPSHSSSYSKAYSHSHSQSAYSYTHTSHSHGYSHSHSHSLTTSNSSKSSRNLSPRGHSRTGSWSKTAFLKAGALCGVGQDDADDRVPSSSRADFTKPRSPPCAPGGEVGIAITSSPSPDYVVMIGSQADQKDRSPSKHTHKSSEYAGPHPSEVDSTLPPPGVASVVSLRHRLPPRPAIHPPITPIAHPYRSAPTQPGSARDKASEAASTKATESQRAADPSTEPASYPHISLSHADFERYGVGEALVYASLPQPEKVAEAKRDSLQNEPLPAVESSPLQERSPGPIDPLPREEPDAASSVMSSPDLTNSTIQMVVSAFDSSDDLDEFQDLFYNPNRDQSQEPSASTNQVPTDVHGSASNSPLTHLVRTLSAAHARRDRSRTPSDSTRVPGRSSLEQHSAESGPKLVFTEFAQSSSSSLPPETPSQLRVPIQQGGEPTAQPIVVIPEDVNSSYTASDVGSPWDERDNDTFGYPIRHGQLEAASPPSPIQTPLRLSTHLSIQEDQLEEDDAAFLSPVTKRFGWPSADVARSSYLTTSDMSQMSGLSDFPLPPSTRPYEHVTVLQTYFEPTSPSPESQDHEQPEETGMASEALVEEDADPSGDVRETLRALRMEPRVSSYDSRRTTFGGSEDMDFITQVHQARP